MRAYYLDEKEKEKQKYDCLWIRKITRMILTVVLMTTSFLLTGCSLPTIAGSDTGKYDPVSRVEDMKDGLAYVWEDNTVEDISIDFIAPSGKEIFFPCIRGRYNFKRQETDSFSQYPRTIWIDSGEDDHIPTVAGNNKLLYVSKKEVPEELVFERFADMDYTIGIANLMSDRGDHYYFPYADLNKDDYKYYVDQGSDAKGVLVFDIISKLYLDKVGTIPVTKENVTAGGTVAGLEKDAEYTCEFYTGTYYQDFLISASIHTFSSMERFVSCDYVFLHSNCIEIKIPEYFKSGYYLINGVGLFRYVSPEDEEKYLSSPDSIDWNDPIIITDEYGNIIKDPSRDIDDEYLYEIDKEDSTEVAGEDKSVEESSDPGLDDIEAEEMLPPEVIKDRNDELPSAPQETENAQ